MPAPVNPTAQRAAYDAMMRDLLKRASKRLAAQVEQERQPSKEEQTT